MRNSPWRTGSIHQASMQAVKRRFLTTWSYKGLSCTISPRATLTRMASSFMRWSSAAPIRPRVARVRGALITSTSAASKSSLSRSGVPIQSTRSLVRPCRLMACTRMPMPCRLGVAAAVGCHWNPFRKLAQRNEVHATDHELDQPRAIQQRCLAGPQFFGGIECQEHAGVAQGFGAGRLIELGEIYNIACAGEGVGNDRLTLLAQFEGDDERWSAKLHASSDYRDSAREAALNILIGAVIDATLMHPDVRVDRAAMSLPAARCRCRNWAGPTFCFVTSFRPASNTGARAWLPLAAAHTPTNQWRTGQNSHPAGHSGKSAASAWTGTTTSLSSIAASIR